MISYWLIFMFCGLLAATESSGSKVNAHGLGFPLIILLIIFVGYRYAVGADWAPYLNQLRDVQKFDLIDIKLTNDPGYWVLTWLGANVAGGIFLPNMVCAVLFVSGLTIFAASHDRPWLIIAVAFPYLLVVVAMGYTRQGTALGLIMAALTAFKLQKMFRFAALVCLAASFHKTAVIFFGLLLISPNINTYIKVILSSFLVILLPVVVIQGVIVDRYATLLADGRESSGAYIRVVMNAISALILLLTFRYFKLRGVEARLWLVFAVLALLFIPLLAVSPSTTAVDRLALYLLPLQLFVWGSLPEVIGGQGNDNRLFTVIVLLYSASVLFVWLNFANNAGNWLPYGFYPWESFWGLIYE